MDFFFLQATNSQKRWIWFLESFKKFKTHGFIFWKLKIPKKHGLSFFFQALKAKIMKGILLRLFWDCKKLSIKNYFHTTCETASKVNQSKLVCFFWIWAILNFNRTRLKINSLTFCKHILNLRMLSHRIFQRMGVRALRARASATRLLPIHWKIRCESILKFKICLQKVKEFILSRGWWNA